MTSTHRLPSWCLSRLRAAVAATASAKATRASPDARPSAPGIMTTAGWAPVPSAWPPASCSPRKKPATSAAVEAHGMPRTLTTRRSSSEPAPPGVPGGGPSVAATTASISPLVARKSSMYRPRSSLRCSTIAALAAASESSSTYASPVCCRPPDRVRMAVETSVWPLKKPARSSTVTPHGRPRRRTSTFEPSGVDEDSHRSYSACSVSKISR
mmetsp:Transcript_33348/g.83137  ORF Transcript_33348/g.83137 Transcript_33348/m.83137 type:complete len:212 (-) Transcript_33348:340-975(-)